MSSSPFAPTSPGSGSMATYTKGPLLVVAAIIRDGDKILVAQRKHDSEFEAGKWEFPGGKVEPSEDPQDTLIREIHEELALDVGIEGLYGLSSHVYRSKTGGRNLHVVLVAYVCSWVGGEVGLRQVADVRWVQPNELSVFEWAEADLPFVEKIGRDPRLTLLI